MSQAQQCYNSISECVFGSLSICGVCVGGRGGEHNHSGWQWADYRWLHFRIHRATSVDNPIISLFHLRPYVRVHPCHVWQTMMPKELDSFLLRVFWLHRCETSCSDFSGFYLDGNRTFLFPVILLTFSSDALIFCRTFWMLWRGLILVGFILSPSTSVYIFQEFKLKYLLLLWGLRHFKPM